MKAYVIKYKEGFSPLKNTIDLHADISKKSGYVWFGKIGSKAIILKLNEVIKSDIPLVILVNDKQKRVDVALLVEVQTEEPLDKLYPDYYKNIDSEFKMWFKLTNFMPVSTSILNDFKVISSGRVLKDSMNSGRTSSYFVESISSKEEELEQCLPFKNSM